MEAETKIVIQRHEVRCDYNGCGYNEAIELADMPNFINKPCPKCNSNLLTEKDFDDYLKLLAVIQVHNQKDGLSEPNPEDATLINVHEGKIITKPL